MEEEAKQHEQEVIRLSREGGMPFDLEHDKPEAIVRCLVRQNIPITALEIGEELVRRADEVLGSAEPVVD